MRGRGRASRHRLARVPEMLPLEPRPLPSTSGSTTSGSSSDRSSSYQESGFESFYLVSKEHNDFRELANSLSFVVAISYLLRQSNKSQNTAPWRGQRRSVTSTGVWSCRSESSWSSYPWKSWPIDNNSSNSWNTTNFEQHITIEDLFISCHIFVESWIG